jgi:enamine deaminase RidA (YjgF/YER057c/UK114 family)
MGSIDQRLGELGIVLPAPIGPPPGVEVRLEFVRISRGYAYVSGHAAADGSTRLMTGKVGGDLDLGQGREAARLAALSMVASLRRAFGDLDRVQRWVKVLGFVNCAPGFSSTPLVLNGFSDTIVEIWGDNGRHARSAVGVAELPFDVPVEVEAIVELAESGRA